MTQIVLADLKENRDLQEKVVSLHVERIYSLQSLLGFEHMMKMYDIILDHCLGRCTLALANSELIGFICLLEEIEQFKKLALKKFDLLRLGKVVSHYPVFLLDIIGHILCEPILRSSKYIYISSFAVHQSEFSSHTAKTLMECAKDYSLHQGKGLSALVRRINKKALVFYDASGFRVSRSRLNLHAVTWKNP